MGTRADSDHVRGRSELDAAIGRACAYLLGRQGPEGWWAGELQADASVTAGYGPLMYYLLGAVDPQKQRKAANYVRSKQNPDGSWSAYWAGPGDLNVSIQCYFSLKLAGLPADDPCLERARQFILSEGGIGRANVLTRIWLALFGQFGWRATPSVPPEVMLLPNWFYLNIYECSSWSRATIVALAVVLTLQPVCRVPEWARVHELYLEPEGQREYPVGRSPRLLSWQTLLLALDSLAKAYDRLPRHPGRATALRRAAQWILKHQEADGSWGGIMLPWVYSLVALKSLGFPLDHPAMARGLAGLAGFAVEDASTLRLQPATSPVWDTAWTVLALREAGIPCEHPALQRAGAWLLGQEIRTGGDWQVKNPHTPPGCWAFEFDNDWYPDLDDTALVPRVLSRVRLPGEQEAQKRAAIARARQWLESMQCRDGGWAAFDLNNDRRILAYTPFADFMTPLDPTCADVTAHVIEFLQESEPHCPSLRRARAYLVRTQEADGAWYGRWGVNYIYGTGLVLAALGSAGPSEATRRAVDWLLVHQNPDGGWGETCASYDDPSLRGRGPSTASQTAWALAGLVAAGRARCGAVQAGVDYLLRTQGPDGAWQEEPFTGTGFPRAFYLRYDLYRAYFPLLALSRYRGACRQGETERAS